MSTFKAKRRNGCLGRTVLALFVITGLSVEVPASADEHPPDSGAPTDKATPDVDINEIGPLGGLYIRGDDPDRVTPAPVLATRLTGEINGLVARFTVRHAFANPGNDWVEGIYVFPLPDKAAVDHLRMETGDRVIEGHIAEREEARKTYEKARKSGRKASLIDQERPNIFTASVANIGPGEEVAVEITFQETLTYDHGIFRLRLPLVVGPRYIPQKLVAVGEEGWSMVVPAVEDAMRISPPVREEGEPLGNPIELEIDLRPGFELARLESATHAIDQVETATGGHRVTLSEGSSPADRDFVLEWEPLPTKAPAAGLFTETVDGERYALLTLMPPEAKPAEVSALPREVVFIIDTSGSMHGASLDQARDALHQALDGLEARDRFNIIEFDSGMSALFPAAQLADARNLAHARAFLDHLEAEGGTEMLPALDFALDGSADPTRLRQVVLLTDGAIGNEAEALWLITREIGDSRLYTVGIGSAPNGYFMTRAARAGRGSPTFIGDLDEVETRMNELLTRLAKPLLTDVRISWPDGAETWPDPVPDLHAGQPLTVVARIPAEAGAVTVSGKLADALWSTTLTVGGGPEATGVGKLWAREKIAALMDGLRQGKDAAEVRASVLPVALSHSLVSRYTSLVAVDTTPSRPETASLKHRAVATNMPEGWSHEHVFGVKLGETASLPQTATPAEFRLIIGLVLLALATLLLMLARRRPA